MCFCNCPYEDHEGVCTKPYPGGYCYMEDDGQEEETEPEEEEDSEDNKRISADK